jgi:hypothetical protein
MNEPLRLCARAQFDAQQAIVLILPVLRVRAVDIWSDAVMFFRAQVLGFPRPDFESFPSNGVHAPTASASDHADSWSNPTSRRGETA